MFKALRNLTTRTSGRIRAQDIDLRTLYNLRMPNGDYVPGRIIEAHRLRERRWNDGIPYVSTETEPSRSEQRVVGLLAVADRTVGAGSRDHLEALRQIPLLVLADDPDQAHDALFSFQEELSRLGPETRLGNRVIQPRTFMRDLTVVDPRRIRPLTDRHVADHGARVLCAWEPLAAAGGVAE
ncbi:hypothetical protein [Streptomyces sp. MMS24-I29]|uniref:hypothetical protein n=1 Tax=Streptomyces sp. MMS24-I29 TaxID=3351480 RepID=UPI003C7A1F32